MNPEKFTIRSLFVLAAILFVAILTQGTTYVNFFLVNPSLPTSVDSQKHQEIISCETVHLQKEQFLSYQPDSLDTSLKKIFSITTPKVSGLYSPFYKSELTFDIQEDSVLKVVTLNLKGSLNLISECETPYVHSILKNSILEFYPDYKYNILLNGSEKEYLELIQPIN
ncbi:hypothetical protein CL656_00210 [bacterium]|nr:hypothetical protein [bacterium]|tara:strand:+ start:2214 stop:2717 length:504 start_codon:yes stop_codon:yes gene_type:complete